MQPHDQCAGSASFAASKILCCTTTDSVVVPSKQKCPEMLELLRIDVPLLYNMIPKVFKKIEIVRQDTYDLQVFINRDCLFAHDKWEMPGQNSMQIGSQHVEDPNKVCPCCCMSYAEVLELPMELQVRLAQGEGHTLNLFHAESDKKEKGSKTGKKGKQNKKEKHVENDKDSLPAGFQG